jgi:DNA-binding LacI/PurR family transcriptional regulator
MKGIRQLAKHLDISIGTVSRALNGKPDVNEETRKRVLEAAVELGYVPNQSGRSLRQGATHTVGFMLESGTASALGGDDFFMSVIEGMQGVLKHSHIDLVLLPCGADEDPYDYLQRMVARRFVDGVVISATKREDPRIDLLTRSNLPFVALGRSRTGSGYSWLDMDFFGVARDAVYRFAARGHRRIAIAIPDNDANLGDIFLDGYRAGLRAHGIALEEELVLRVESSEEGGAEAARRILAMNQKPTAILLNYELMAIGLYPLLNEAGIRPGGDIAVIGFRKSAQTRFLHPQLTAYTLSLHDLGVALAGALLSEIRVKRAGMPVAPANIIWPMQVVESDSDLNGPPTRAS